MVDWFKAGLGIVVAGVILWLVWTVLSFIFGVVATIVNILLTLVIFGVLLYAGYVLVSKLMGGSGSGTSTRQRERLYE